MAHKKLGCQNWDESFREGMVNFVNYFCSNGPLEPFTDKGALLTKLAEGLINREKVARA